MNLTPKQKADELIDKFSTSLKLFDELEGWVEYIDSSKAKGHALVAVDEIIQIDVLINEDIYVEKPSYLQYWLDVKDEILNL